MSAPPPAPSRAELMQARLERTPAPDAASAARLAEYTPKIEAQAAALRLMLSGVTRLSAERLERTPAPDAVASLAESTSTFEARAAHMRMLLNEATRMSAERARNLELAALAARTCLSPAEEVLSIPFLYQRSVMSFLTQMEALPLRSASSTCRDAVAEHAWGVEPACSSRIWGSLASWRRCFPRAIFASVFQHYSADDDDFTHLRTIRTLNMVACMFITDAGLAHLSGIHTLDMSMCRLVTDAPCHAGALGFRV